MAFLFILIAKAATQAEGKDEHTLYALGLVAAALIYVGFARFNGGNGSTLHIA